MYGEISEICRQIQKSLYVAHGMDYIQNKEEPIMSYAYVGCRSTKERNARGKGIKVFEISDKTGEWKEIQCLKTEENPSYQALDNEEKYLYSVHGDFTKVTSYRILEDHTLEYMNMVDIGGKNPVFITPDKTNQYVVVAALQGGAVYVIRRNEDGSLGDIVNEVHFEGKTEGSVSFAHQCIWDQKREYLFVVMQGRIQGYGQVRVLRFHPEDGSFTQTDQYLAPNVYDEPRHISIHPNNRWAYLINEKGNKMTFFEFDEVNGKLTALQNLPTLPATYTGEGQASASVLNEKGDILIGSNRIHESVVVYRVDQNTGYMTELGYYSCLGLTPRFVTFNSDYSRFYIANEDSDTIVEMKLDSDKGILEYTGRIIPTESPVCITFIQEGEKA